jgi:hypothetical protein
MEVLVNPRVEQLARFTVPRESKIWDCAGEDQKQFTRQPVNSKLGIREALINKVLCNN